MLSWILEVDGEQFVYEIPPIRSNDEGARSEAERRVIDSAKAELQLGAKNVQILNSRRELVAEGFGRNLVRVSDGQRL